jgi:hypothetical protein
LWLLLPRTQILLTFLIIRIVDQTTLVDTPSRLVWNIILGCGIQQMPRNLFTALFFCMGTGAVPEDYASTGEHLASHGFAAIYTPMRPWDVTKGLDYCRDATIVTDAPELEGLLNTTRLGTGGHSGGGPYAVHASSGVKDVAVVIAQHCASIPVMNRQSDETMAALEGDLMVLCGTDDHMPFCGCDVGERDYYDRAPHGRALVKVPDNHVSGACFESGANFEAGYITAMLYYGLRGGRIIGPSRFADWT